MEADRAVLCGPKGRHQVERPAWRGGSVESVESQVTLAHGSLAPNTRRAYARRARAAFDAWLDDHLAAYPC